MLRKMDSRQHILNLPCCMGSSVDEKGVFGSDYCGCRIHCLHPLDKYCGCSCTLAPMVPTLMSSSPKLSGSPSFPLCPLRDQVVRWGSISCISAHPEAPKISPVDPEVWTAGLSGLRTPDSAVRTPDSFRTAMGATSYS